MTGRGRRMKNLQTRGAGGSIQVDTVSAHRERASRDRFGDQNEREKEKYSRRGERSGEGGGHGPGEWEREIEV